MSKQYPSHNIQSRKLSNKSENQPSNGLQKGAELSGDLPPCQDRHNYIGNPNTEYNTSPRLTSRSTKKLYAHENNIKRFMALVVLEHLAFVTLTFKENITDHREASRRLRSLYNALRREFGWNRAVKIVERQARGAIHYHLLVDMGYDCMTGFDHNTPNGWRNRAPVGSRLHYDIERLRKLCVSHGFGQVCSIEPPKHSREGLVHYLTKYLVKGLEQSDNGNYHVNKDTGELYSNKHMRLVEYWGKWGRWSPNFSWSAYTDERGKTYGDNGKLWRYGTRKVATLFGISDIEGLSLIFGSKWAYHLKEVIQRAPTLTNDTIRKLVKTIVSTTPSMTDHIEYTKKKWHELCHQYSDGIAHISSFSDFVECHFSDLIDSPTLLGNWLDTFSST